MTLQHLRSSTANKRPDPTAMADGQIALNTAAASPGLFYKDSAGNLVKAGPVHVGSTAPNVSPASGGTAGNSTGESWLDTSGSNPLLKVWNGSSWQTVQPVASGTVVSTADTGSVTSTMIANGTIVDADVNASAAIAGTKISPNFGSQNVTTTGTSTAASFIPTSSTVPTNGVYLPAANSVAISTNSTGRVFVDSSGRVGIGSSSVDSGLKLQIVDGTASKLRLNVSGYAGLEIGHNSDFTSEINQRSGQALLLKTSDTERLRITSAGLVGIGTSVPSYQLDCVGGSGLRVQRSSGSTIAFFENTGSVNPNIAFAGSTTTSTPYIGVTANDLVFGTNGADRVRLDSSGRLGIGTTTPGDKLHVVGPTAGISARFSDGINATVAISHPSAGTSQISDYGGNYGLQFTSGSVNILTAGSERARIDGSGRLLVGTSSDSSTALLTVKGQSGSNGPGTINLATSQTTSYGNGSVLGRIRFGETGSAVGGSIELQSENNWTGSSYPSRLVFSVCRDGSASPTEAMRISNGGRSSIYADTDVFRLASNQGGGTAFTLIEARNSETSTTTTTGAVAFRVYTNGNTQNTNNSYAGTSDIKLKENIVDASSQWDDIKALQVRKYNFKEGPTHTQIGLVAQEVELVSPGLVYETPDRDADGNDLGTTTKAVQYSVLYMKAVKALQEAMERIEQLETSNADLLARVTALESA